MTTVILSPGICGFDVTITAEKEKDKKIRISLYTECEMVKKMLEDISLVDIMAVFTRYQNNPVYRSAALHLKHVACSVPAGILKTVEVEAGLCLPKNVSIVFLKE